MSLYYIYNSTNGIKFYSQQGQGFHVDPQDHSFQRDPEVPQVRFCQQVPLLQPLPVIKIKHISNDFLFMRKSNMTATLSSNLIIKAHLKVTLFNILQRFLPSKRQTGRIRGFVSSTLIKCYQSRSIVFEREQQVFMYWSFRDVISTGMTGGGRGGGGIKFFWQPIRPGVDT